MDCHCWNCQDAIKHHKGAGPVITTCCECGENYPVSKCRGESLCPDCDEFNNGDGFAFYTTPDLP